MADLFTGYGIAHTILLFAVVIALGLFLGRFKIKGVSIGSTWILFVGIILSHFGFRANPTALSFMKDFGLILFVFSIGLQVGPGFFHSFRKGGVTMNLLAVGMVLMAGGMAILIHYLTGERLDTMVGVMSGAVTNTPGLGAAQQTLSDVLVAEGISVESASDAASRLASSYAVAYPLGVLGVIMMLIIYKSVFKVDVDKEREVLDNEEASTDAARRMHCEVENPAIFGKTLGSIMAGHTDEFVVSRMMRDGTISVPGPDTILQKGDKVLIVTSQHNVDTIRIIFGEEVPMHLEDWKKMDVNLVSRRLSITKSSLTGQHLKNLHIRSFPQRTVDPDRGLMDHGTVFYDGQAQAGTAGLPGVALVYPVKAFKDPVSGIVRNADPGISDAQEDAILLWVDLYEHAAPFLIIFDRVIDKIVDHFIQDLPESPHPAMNALQAQADIPVESRMISSIRAIMRWASL